jgi:shikimate kinase
MIVLLGYMGSGKTSVSQFLYKKYHLIHCDLDQYIEKHEKKSISEIFEDKGEIYFRKIENKYLKRILSENNCEILSLGGGTPCYANNMELLKSHQSKSIYLKVDLEELTKRLFENKSKRPLVKDIQNSDQMKDFIRKHLFEREFYYRQAKHMINTTNLTIKEIAEKVLSINQLK